MRAVSNTSPICYLILIDEIQILPQLFTEILIPSAVREELAHPDSPALVRGWIADPPDWLSVVDLAKIVEDPELNRLDQGEREAISLAADLKPELLLLDDWKARQIARDRKLPMTGLIGVLDLAIEQRLVDAAAVVEGLRSTTFRVSEELLQLLIRQSR